MRLPCRLFETMKQHNVRPDSTTAYHLVRTSMLLERRSLAEAYVRDFESNGIRCAAFRCGLRV